MRFCTCKFIIRGPIRMLIIHRTNARPQAPHRWYVTCRHCIGWHQKAGEKNVMTHGDSCKLFGALTYDFCSKGNMTQMWRVCVADTFFSNQDAEWSEWYWSERTRRPFLRCFICMTRYTPAAAPKRNTIMRLFTAKKTPRADQTFNGTAASYFNETVRTRCSAIAERPRCRVRYSFRQK